MLLDHLETKLQDVIDRVRGEGECVFVKTTCRSAKDTAIFDVKFRYEGTCDYTYKGLMYGGRSSGRLCSLVIAT